MASKKATWTNGNKKQTGSWTYIWHRDTFAIHLDSKDPVSGRQREFYTSNEDSPEWGNWKLQRETEGE